MGTFSLEGKSVLVAGGMGFIGSHFVDRLIQAKPSQITVVDNMFLGNPENLNEAKKAFPKLKIITRDLTVMDIIKDLFDRGDARIDVVVDFATIPLPAAYAYPEYTFFNNVKIVMNFCELLRKGLFELYCHCSSSEALGTCLQSNGMNEDHPFHPTTTYGSSKSAQDLYIEGFDKMYDIPYLIFRPFNNFGQRQNDKSYAGIIPLVVKRILSGMTPEMLGDGKQTREYVYVKDTADAVLRLIENDQARKQVVHIGNGREVEIGYLIKLICDIMGYKGEVHRRPPRANDVRRHLCDNTKLKSFIDYKPQSLESQLPSVVKWFSERITRELDVLYS